MRSECKFTFEHPSHMIAPSNYPWHAKYIYVFKCGDQLPSNLSPCCVRLWHRRLQRPMMSPSWYYGECESDSNKSRGGTDEHAFHHCLPVQL